MNKKPFKRDRELEQLLLTAKERLKDDGHQKIVLENMERYKVYGAPAGNLKEWLKSKLAETVQERDEGAPDYFIEMMNELRKRFKSE